jgi:uncharacterized peroxidase-related enzyme
MHAHSEDLRAEIPASDSHRETLLRALQHDYREAPLDAADRAMLDFAVELTLMPQAMTKEHVEALRRVGFDDVAIHDIVQVTGFFNLYNRIADGLGVDSEPEFPAVDG